MTRPGVENCDVSDGVLLDVTPVIVDDVAVITLYNKDLTDGINLLVGRPPNPTLDIACLSLSMQDLLERRSNSFQARLFN